MNETWQDRVKEEACELHSKRQDLIDFMHGNKYAELDGTNQGLLVAQLAMMNGYADILCRRIELF